MDRQRRSRRFGRRGSGRRGEAETSDWSLNLGERDEADALHIATAAAHGMDYLLTWNCTHIASATLRMRIEAVCRGEGFEPPAICTPEELPRGGEDDDRG